MASSLATTHDMPDLQYSPFLATFETPGYARFSAACGSERRF
jgi:hypothetical protein